MTIRFLEARRIGKEFRYVVWTDTSKQISEKLDPAYVITLFYPAKPDSEYRKSIIEDVLTRIRQHNMETASKEEILPEEGTEMSIEPTSILSKVSMFMSRR